MHEVSLFEAILQTNLINFIIVIATLALIFKKAHLGDLIQKMADDIKADVEKSALSAQSALKEYKEVKKQTKDTPQIEENIIKQANINAQILKGKIQEKTNIKKEEIAQTLERRKISQAEKYKKLTAQEIYQASVNIAQDEIKTMLNDEFHQKLIKSSIDELDKIEGKLNWKI